MYSFTSLCVIGLRQKNCAEAGDADVASYDSCQLLAMIYFSKSAVKVLREIPESYKLKKLPFSTPLYFALYNVVYHYTSNIFFSITVKIKYQRCIVYMFFEYVH